MKKGTQQLANLLVLCLGVGLFFANGQDLSKPLLALDGVETAPAPGVLERQQFLQTIKSQLQSAQSDYMDVNRNAHEAKDKLLGIQEERLTLQNQLSILSQQIENTVAITQNVLVQIDEKENQITQLQAEIKIKNLEIENQKKMLSEYLAVLYKDENAMDDTTQKESSINIAKMLLSDKSPEEALREVRYFSILEATGHNIFDKLEKLVQEEQRDQLVLENSRNKLEMLYRQLKEQQTVLKMQQQAKAQLLEETKGQENIYQQLLDESEQEEGQVLEDINSLRTNLKFIQDKIAQLGDKFNPDDYKNLFGQGTTNVLAYINEHAVGDFAPRWPVSPSRGISAYFHDESYRRAMGVPHEAIDIRALQSTPIHAPADGVVYKTRDNGFGYSYIILAHAGGFMTVYGHVSEIRVKEGEKIQEGQVIGLSGATPGTKGAGLMTTGAHLHFEVLQGGKHVDPLDYLPLAYLPLDSLPAKYLSRITGDAIKVSRSANDSGVAGEDLLQKMENAGMFGE